MARSRVFSRLCLPLIAAASPLLSVTARAHPAEQPVTSTAAGGVLRTRPVVPRIRAELPLRRVNAPRPELFNRQPTDARRVR